MKTKINKDFFCFEILRQLFEWIQKKHFNQKHHDGKIPYYTIIEIKGWRTALVETCYGQRSTITFL